jgi:PAS domain S-box-containing protein
MHELWGTDSQEPHTLETWLARIDKEDRDRIEQRLEQMFANHEKNLNEEFRIDHPTRGGRWINALAKMTYDQNGQALRLIGINIDITERKLIEYERLRAQEHVQMLFDSIEDYAVFTMDLKGRVNSWNKGAERIFGYSDREIIGQSADLLFTPEDRKNDRLEEMRQALEGGHAAAERWHIRKNGSRFFASGIMTVLQDGEAAGYVKVLRDLTERQKMEEKLLRTRDELDVRVKERTADLESSNLQIKYLLNRIVTTQELERRRISRELHDHLGQQLTGLRLSLESLKGRGVNEPQLQEEIIRLQAMVRQIDSDLDFLAWELRPVALEEVGVVAALENFVQEWSKHFAIAAEFHTAGLNKDLTIEVETNLYRIAQEALNNVVKHAEASRVDVIFERRNNNAVLIIGDDGKGFDPEDQSARGIGMLSMRERAALIGGTLEIESAPGEGTTIFVRVPAREASQ